MGKLAMAAALAAVLMISASAAARTDYETNINVLEFTNTGDGDVLVSGRLESEKGKCVRSRTLKVSFDEGSGFELVDEGVSSRAGGFGLLFPNEDGTLRIKATRKVIGDDVCQPATYLATERR